MTLYRCHLCGTSSNWNESGRIVKAASHLMVDLDAAPAKESRHYTLLNSNEVPLESDFPSITALLSETDAPLAALDEEIAKVRERLEELESRRTIMFDFRQRNSAILSPLRRMPPEVLGEIFYWASPMPQDIPMRRKFSLSDSPWSFTHVCRRWRAISIGRPSLWSLVAISYHDDVNPASSYPFPMVETQIERSQAQQLKIHFYGCESGTAEPQVKIFGYLAKYASRWEELSLGLTSALLPFQSGLQGCIPNLRRLWVEWIHSASQVSAERVEGFDVAPSLVDAGVFNEHRFIPLSLPTHQLTRYELDGPWDSHRNMLKLATNLVEARIFVAFDDTLWQNSDEKISVPSLKRLYVSHAEVLQFLTFPCLEELAVQVQEHEITFFSTHIHTSLSRSSCPLRALCIAGYPIPAETLRNLPSTITELMILINDPAAPRIKADLLVADLANERGDGFILPQLTRIFLGFEVEGGMNFALYLDILGSRFTSPKAALAVAALLILTNQELDPGASEKIGELRSEGLDLAFLRDSEAREAARRWTFLSPWN
ncbi:F-box domain-containing protein [Favolaschia claudopus]|uniref:F-box domain-containing protein n=1 Tax=Favolaschia claudopus TaxID=2862362 RepID=A0AAW0BUS5_9AGAR